MRILKWAFISICVAGSIWAGAKIAFDEYPEVKRLREECSREAAVVEELKRERDHVTREIHELDDDPRAVERVARSEGWVKKGETVILIPEKNTDDK
ncbi:MAG: hypothetical protein C0608_03420 [Deltaproteobacteria bacterium]|nr:MAG: hypothetical protein C0608_03420 [Deltaproteobacteria bacterium]